MNEQTLLSTRKRDHSRQPEEFYQWVEKLCPDLSKLEIFTRQPRPGWERWGNEVEKFALDQ